MSAFTMKEDSDILALYGQVCEGRDTTCKHGVRKLFTVNILNIWSPK